MYIVFTDFLNEDHVTLAFFLIELLASFPLDLCVFVLSSWQPWTLMPFRDTEFQTKLVKVMDKVFSKIPEQDIAPVAHLVCSNYIKRLCSHEMLVRYEISFRKFTRY